jgi:hypothetical protein
MTQIYLVMADAIVYIDANSPEEAEEKAEAMTTGDWDIQNFIVSEDIET